MLCAAAFLFSQGIREAEALASLVGVSEGTIRRWSKLREWDDALDELLYFGDRTLEKSSDSDELIDSDLVVPVGKQTLEDAIKSGKSKKETMQAVNDEPLTRQLHRQQ